VRNYISPSAELVGEVTLGEGNFIGDNCRIYGPVTIGNNNHFAPGVIVGLAGQDDSLSKDIHDRTARGEPRGEAELVIGSDNVFREFSTIHRGIAGITSVGSGIYLMTYANISHNSDIQDNVKIASNVQMGGYSTICTGAYIGMAATIHQFTVIGAFSMVGMGSVVTRDITTISKAFGNPCREVGPNVVALENQGISSADWWGKQDFAYVDKQYGSSLRDHHDFFLNAVERRGLEKSLVRKARARSKTAER
jgi:UDP-N-acetylglucosamine acyltransferase